MSIALLHPVFDAMKAQGCDHETLAKQLKVPGSALENPSTMLPAKSVYAFLEWATEQTGDLWLCARIGQSMARGGWAPINPLLRDCRTVWEFLQRFSMVAEDQGGAVVYRLEVESRIALWKLVRPNGSPENARFADAMAVGFFVELIRSAGGKHFDPEACVSMTSGEQLIPADILPHASVIAGVIGTVLRFPSDWLNWKLAEISSHPNLPEAGLPDIGVNDLKARVSSLLEQQIADPSFGIDRVADAVGMPKWKLQRALRTMNTSVADLRNEVRLTVASGLLCSGELSVSDIATSLGYNSPSNFSRAFRSQTGQSPAEFRSCQIRGT